MTNHLFEKIEDVEDSIKQYAPKIIYKYRSDWENDNNRKFIKEQAAWFACPEELNDPYDIRIPVRFDTEEIENPIFLSKLKEAIKFLQPSIAFTERDLNVICENKMEEIRKDPKSYFENNYKDIRAGKIFETVGLFSCTSDGLNETMWAHYGNNHSGFAVGFNTLELARSFMWGFGPVKYSDEITFHSFLNFEPDNNLESLYLKSMKWAYEKEFRFTILGIENNTSRLKRYNINSVVEFLLGSKFPESQMSDFVQTIQNIFTAEIPIYQVNAKVSGFGLEKNKIN